MGLAIKYENREGYLCIIASGVFAIDDARRAFRQALEVIDTSQASKVLIDCREVTGSPTTVDYYDYGELIAEELTKPGRTGAARTLKLAHVARPPLLDERRLSETVARNRGVRMKSLDNMEDAVTWLGQG